MEIWKDIKGYEGMYQVSNLGNVRSLNYNRTGKIKILSPYKCRGYLKIKLRECNYWVHRLVAEAFIPNEKGLPEVNHKDENKENNKADNLEWCTHMYNVNYGTRGIRAGISSMNGKNSRSIIGVNMLNGYIINYPSVSEAGRSGFTPSNIIKSIKGDIKHHKGFIWMYDNEVTV